MKKNIKETMGDALDKLRKRSGIAIIITAGVLIEATSLVQYVFTSNAIRREIEQRAKTELKINNLEIQRVVTEVEVALNNSVWIVEQNLDKPDSIVGILHRIVESNKNVVGCGIGFIDSYYPQKGRWFEPYAAKSADSQVINKQIGRSTHNYLEADWFLSGLNSSNNTWSEPYYDDSGANTMVCSYTKPVHDASGRIVAVLCADVSLEWLVEVFRTQPTEHASAILVSKTGQILACPIKELVMQTTVQDVTRVVNDSMKDVINNGLISGDSGYAVIHDNDGYKNYVYYAPVEGTTGWAMALVYPDKEIFHGLRTVAIYLFIFMLLGLALLSFIMYRTVTGYRKLGTVKAEKERIANELKIASGIQMGMLPKTFPPYPDRNEVTIYGLLTPAKEVGGDLYDFYIRDSKLFFCIGDVSGKGIPASLVMAVTRSLFRSVSLQIDSPELITTRINNAMSEMNESSMFVTLFIGVLDLKTGVLTYCNAGHNPPVTANGHVALLNVDANIPVGLMPNWHYTLQQCIMQPSSSIFLYTDGITEAENNDHGQYGEDRMIEIIGKIKDLPTKEFINTIHDDVLSFVNGAEQSDDMTMMAIRFTHPILCNENNNNTKTITLPNDVQTIPQLAEFIDQIADSNGINPSEAMSLNLAMEEAVVNVMEYAYPEGTKGDIDIAASINDDNIIFTITDSGVAFDPTAVNDPDLDKAAEERPIGGLGIHLVRQIMDTVSYERKDGKNILSLKKKI